MSASVNWRDDAACARADPDLFFPVSATGLALSQIDEAKRVCQGCPARTPCLEWALEHGVAAVQASASVSALRCASCHCRQSPEFSEPLIRPVRGWASRGIPRCRGP